MIRHPASQTRIDPDGFLDNLAVRVVTAAGEEIVGRRVNEDSFTIQFRDRQNRYYSFRKTEIKVIRREPGTRLMPGFEGVLSDKEIEDLVSVPCGSWGKEMILRLLILSALLILPVASAKSQVPYERLVSADREPQHWLTYSGNYSAHRYSSLSQIHPGNVSRLKVSWDSSESDSGDDRNDTHCRGWVDIRHRTPQHRRCARS